jgi:hypothetical protein
VAAVNLDASMVADEDIRALNGQVLVPKGEQLTCPLLERLRSFATAVGIIEPVKVLLPQDAVFRDRLNQNVRLPDSMPAESEPGIGASAVLESH